MASTTNLINENDRNKLKQKLVEKESAVQTDS
jgi:hypothetical protein